MKKIGIMNGPNLDRLGAREPNIYGRRTLKELEHALLLDAQQLGVELHFCQSNHEGELIDKMSQWAAEGFVGLIINPAAYSHTSIALRDAIAGSGLLAVEVHISNIYRREEFRQKTLTGGACTGVISGLGFEGYHAALYYVAGKTR